MAAILSSVSTVATTVFTLVGNVAETIAGNPLLTLFAIAVPVISFGAGMLIRLIHRV